MKKSLIILAILLLPVMAVAGSIHSVTIPEITIHYVIDPDLMPCECGNTSGCVIWSKYDGERIENVWILARKTRKGIEAKDWRVLEHEIQHIVNRTDPKFTNPDDREKRYQKSHDPCKPETTVAKILNLPGVYAFYAYNITDRKWVVEICARGYEPAVGIHKDWQTALNRALCQYHRCWTGGE